MLRAEAEEEPDPRQASNYSTKRADVLPDLEKEKRVLRKPTREIEKNREQVRAHKATYNCPAGQSLADCLVQLEAFEAPSSQAQSNKDCGCYDDAERGNCDRPDRD